jgi:hypothetical protein
MASNSEVVKRIEKRITQLQNSDKSRGRRDCLAIYDQEEPRLYHSFMLLVHKSDDEDSDDDRDEPDEDDEAEGEAVKPVRPTKKGKKPKKEKASSAIENWNAAVALKRQQGMRPDAAVRAAAREFPNLRTAAIAEVNGTASPLAPPTRAQVDQCKQVARDVQAEFDAAVAAKMRAGLSRNRAIAAVVKSQPRLHDRLIASSNAARLAAR